MICVFTCMSVCVWGGGGGGARACVRECVCVCVCVCVRAWYMFEDVCGGWLGAHIPSLLSGLVGTIMVDERTRYTTIRQKH